MISLFSCLPSPVLVFCCCLLFLFIILCICALHFCSRMFYCLSSFFSLHSSLHPLFRPFSWLTALFFVLACTLICSFVDRVDRCPSLYVSCITYFHQFICPSSWTDRSCISFDSILSGSIQFSSFLSSLFFFLLSSFPSFFLFLFFLFSLSYSSSTS